MSTVNWQIGHYGRTAVGINSANYDGTVTDEYIKHAFDMKWSIPLNGVDEFEFSLYLDDPAAALINKKTSIIRVWRTINDTANSKTKSKVSGTPDFVGVVMKINKSGSGNTMTVKAMSPLWLIQNHFHIANHRLVTDTSAYGDTSDYEGGNANDLPWDQSALMFRLIDLINGAFNDSGGDTGIRRPTTRAYSGHGYLTGESLYWPQTVLVPMFFVQKGSYTWPYLMDDLLTRPGSPDIVPEYIYSSGSRNLMYFKTAIVRGTDRFSSVSFDYRTGNKNIENVEEESMIAPGEYGNFVWTVGDGGANGGTIGEASNPTDMAASGLYMVRHDMKGTKKGAAEDLADSHLAAALKNDDPLYTVEMSPAAPLYYGIDYFLGDRIKLNASRGALSVVNSKQRVYSVALAWSDNHVETTSLQISSDFKSKFPP